LSSASKQRGLSALRKQTDLFIADDPTDIVLKQGKRTATETASGGMVYGDDVARDSQTFKLINSGGDFDGVVDTGDGKVRRFNYVILGKYNAEVDIGDWWEDGGTRYEVTAALVKNDYETKHSVIAYGKDPNYG